MPLTPAGQSTPLSGKGRTVRWWELLLISIPPIYFYCLLSRSLTVFPFLDDYDSVLTFLLQWQHQSVLQHLHEILTFQHNEYKLIFESAVIGLQYSIMGHADIRLLSILGDLLVLPILFALYLLWREGTLPERYGWISLVPASWILFQLQYASTLNCAMAPLQNIPVILFALLSIYCAATARNHAKFAAALLFLALSVASSGNGIFLIPIGALLVLQQKEYKRLSLWLAAGLLIAAVYFHKYNFASSQAHADHNVLSSFRHFSIAYAAAFLGSAGAASNPMPAVILGLTLVAIFLYATWDRLYRRNPALYYCGLFFIVTAFAVSGLRSELGLVTGIGSRYRINSAVMVILMYFYLAEKCNQLQRTPSLQRALLAVFALGLVGFNLMSNRAGSKLLITRRAKIDAAMLRWERGEPRPTAVAPADPTDYTYKNELKGFYEPDEPTLSEAIQAGIYPRPEPNDR